MTKQIYRGYDIEEKDGKWIVSLGGIVKATADREQAAIDFINIEKRRERHGL